MAKNGQAKVLSNEELGAVLDEIENHRYPTMTSKQMAIEYLGLMMAGTNLSPRLATTR